MKKFYYLAVSLAIVFSAASCQKTPSENIEEEAKGNPNQNETPATGSDAMSAYEQKQKLEEVGKALLAELDSDNWAETLEFVQDLSYHLGELESKDGALDQINEWVNSIENQMSQGEYNESDMSLIYKVTIDLALFKGTFTEQRGVFVYDDSNKSNLKVITYLDGSTVTLTVDVGAEKGPYQVYYDEWESYGNYYYDGNGNSYPLSKETDYGYVKIPEFVEATITKDSQTMIKVRLDIKVTDVNSDGELSLSDDKISVSASVTVGDYSVNVSEASFENNTAGASVKLSHGSKQLVSAAANINIEKDWSENMNFEDVEFKAATLSIDVMGAVQVKGEVDYDQYLFYISNAYNNQNNKESFTSALENAEKALNLSVYYDNKPGRQAWLGLEPIQDEGVWTYDVVIRFADGSASSVSSFFSENNFKSLIDAFDKWVSKIDNLVGGK